MKYLNPVVRGFYPDPSICAANGKYYMVCRSYNRAYRRDAEI